MKKNIVKNVISLYGLTIAKMVFPLLTLPYLTRVLSVESYGMVSYSKSIISYIQIVIDFAFVLSGTKDIVNSLNDRKKINLITFDIMFARIILSFLAFIVLIILINTIPVLKGYELYMYISFLSPFLSIFLFDYAFRGMEKMEVLTIRFFITKTITTLLTFILVKDDSSILLIPILDLLGSFVAAILSIINLKNLGIDLINIKFSFKRSIECIKNAFSYFISDASTLAFSSLNTIIIGIYMSASDIAYWSLCIQIVSTIQRMYGPVIDGIYPEMIKTKNISLIKRIIKIMVPIIFFGCVFTYFVSGIALTIIGGPKYTEASIVLKLLIPVLFFGFLSMLFGWPVLGPINKQTCVAKSTVISASTQIIFLIIFIVFGHFNLISISIARSITEIVLFSTRLLYTIKFRKEFSYE